MQKKKADWLLLFLKAFSWETVLWVMLGDFYGKRRKIRKENLYLTENRFTTNEMWCAVVNHSYICHICAKGFLNTNFTKAGIDKISIFHEIAPNFTYSVLELFRPTACFHPINLWQGHVRNTLFHFCQLWAVKSSTCRECMNFTWCIPIHKVTYVKLRIKTENNRIIF